MMRLTSANDFSAAELRVVPWLPMFLSFADIGERVGMSAATVRTVAIGLYRRLEVASRPEAVQRCVELGVLAAAPVSGAPPAAPPPADEDVRPSLESLDEAFFRMTAVRDATGRIVDFRYHYCNRAALAVLGRRREQVFGGSLLEMFPSHRTDGLFDAYVVVVESGNPLASSRCSSLVTATATSCPGTTSATASAESATSCWSTTSCRRRSRRAS
jgi:PAS domain-containing protein